MPIEDYDEGLEKIPDLNLAQQKYLAQTMRYKNDKQLREKILSKVISDNMAPFYCDLCKDLKWSVDDSLLQKMKAANDVEILKLSEAIEDAEKHQGETEVREAMLKKAEFYSRIGDKDNAITQFRKASEKTVTLGYRLDIVFHLIRLGMFFMDHDLIKRNIAKAHDLIEEGGDWDRRNRLKVYKGVYYMATRDFANAAALFLETIATFTSYELMDYKRFVTYCVLCCVVSLKRPELHEKVVKGAEVLEVLHALPETRSFLFSFYNCSYAEFFHDLAQVEEDMKHDRYLEPHYRFYVREMRIRAYNQLLQSYKSLTLIYMAKTFGVSTEFVDKELARFIATGRLYCKIDKVSGIVETTSPDNKNFQYQSSIKQGDVLLNRVQKLSRVINI